MRRAGGGGGEVCDCACVRAGVMERVGALISAPALARGVTPGSARFSFLSTASPAAPLRSCLRSALGALLLLDCPLFC